MSASYLYLLLFIIPGDVPADGTVCDGGGCDKSGGEDVGSGGTV